MRGCGSGDPHVTSETERLIGVTHASRAPAAPRWDVPGGAVARRGRPMKREDQRRFALVDAWPLNCSQHERETQTASPADSSSCRGAAAPRPAALARRAPRHRVHRGLFRRDDRVLDSLLRLAARARGDVHGTFRRLRDSVPVDAEAARDEHDHVALRDRRMNDGLQLVARAPSVVAARSALHE